MKKYIIGFILGSIIFGTIGSVVAYQYSASQVSYTPKDTSWNVNNVDDAIKDLKRESGGYIAFFNGNSDMNWNYKELPLIYNNENYTTADGNSIIIEKSGRYQIISTPLHCRTGNTTTVIVYKNNQEIQNATLNLYTNDSKNDEFVFDEGDKISVKYYTDGVYSTLAGGTVVVIKK